MHSQENATPGYMKIQHYVSEKIRSGEYPVGGKIPSETELAEQFSVSRITANKAIKEMALMGLLERVRGRGTFVCAHPHLSTSAKAFASAVKLDVTGSRHHQLLQFRVMGAYPELAERAKVAEGTPFYEIILANKDGERNESLDYTYIPCSLIDDITPTLDYLRSHFVFDYLRTQPGLEPRFLKVFINLPQYDFLQSASRFLDGADSMSVWCTDVYDATMDLMAATYTAYPGDARDIPLFTFAL
ncbi:GntR family transcriptional regulator [Intestinimonas massiliensis]|jgi:DNA-binding GntR family transcriptional regulator|uniref:GntR family transcriptional regulator n=1 Tax=Intestinimonas massiliensis (ex Afouda et al. 2020) TaxID=1673721 RepID=A0AAW5JM33_9FIRM|nr:GntR family transcriptional regulator [Intestinimonas massiliensis (ex Afouda et al. 2020)]MCQ4769867.1 GntR family transcriptional regulator [Intestinimonas massiliensis (ex Afouda et al. 2020)]